MVPDKGGQIFDDWGFEGQVDSGYPVFLSLSIVAHSSQIL